MPGIISGSQNLEWVMSMLKRATFILFIFTLMMSVTTQVYASDDLTFSIYPQVTAAQGDNITVPIIVSNNPGFAAAGLLISYDPNVLEKQAVNSIVPEMPLNSQFRLMDDSPGTQWIHLINPGSSDWAGNGTVVNMIFRVKTNAPIGVTIISMRFTNSPDGTPSNANGDILSGSVAASGWLNINAASQSQQQQTPIPPPPQPQEPDDWFIGYPYPVDGDSSTGGDQSEDTTSGNTGEQPFGVVPQTGVNGITMLLAAMCLTLAALVFLSVFVLRYIKAHR
jgi:preprotein translocase subunit SecG